MNPYPSTPSPVAQILDRENVFQMYCETAKKIRPSSVRFFFLDYDGTLAPIVPNPSDAKPSPKVKSILSKLCEVDGNFVYIISGRDRNCLEDWLGDIGDIGFSAEHGCFLKLIHKKASHATPSSKEEPNGAHESNGLWIDIPKEKGMDIKWIPNVISLMKDFCFQCPGSAIEKKTYALVWHYRNAQNSYNPESLALKLIENLKSMDGGHFNVIHGKKNVEVRPSGINKGIVVKELLDRHCHDNVDFVLCIGDDTTDEDMFQQLSKEKGIQNVFTVRVGEEESTSALNYVKKQEEVIQILEMLVSGECI